MKRLVILVWALAVIAPYLCKAEDTTAEYSVEAYGNASTGDFAPYYIGSLTHGKHAQANSAMLDAKITKHIDANRRFSWGYGAEGITGHSSCNDYEQWDQTQEKWITHSAGPSAIWLQQLYGEVKYRSVFFTVGMKERGSALFNQWLSSGDLVESGNARPIPEARIGFIDFQDIPFTNGWVQIQGEISYGKMADDNYLKKHYNYYDYHITLGSYYTYKRCYFRTNPNQPLSVTVGMQVGGFYGGEMYRYMQGKLEYTRKYSASLKSMFKMFLPLGENGEDYYTGSSLGSWDLKARYRLKNNDEVCAYVSWPWEDGSGIGRCNKFDGIWGLEYKSARKGWLNGFVAEYIDFRDQSGPLHWDPDDNPGTSITSHATGRDDYYNNAYYNSYANYGMSIGSPFLVSPIYNLDGYPAFACTRANGFHIGAMGNVAENVDYRLLLGYQRGLGSYSYPYHKAKKNTSMMLETCWNADKVLKGLNMRMQVAFDSGKLRGNNFGASISVVYKGKL